MGPSRKQQPLPPKPAPAPAKPQTFGAAFAAARKSGLKQFEYKGKKYTTELKEEKERKLYTPITKMENKASSVQVPSTPSEPVMAKREVKIETPEKKKRLLEMLSERAKGRKPSGMNPMSGFSVATASDYLSGGKGKTMMGGGMVKKYSGGGKMEEYKKGGKMDKKKAFMEMIAKLKSKKK